MITERKSCGLCVTNIQIHGMPCYAALDVQSKNGKVIGTIHCTRPLGHEGVHTACGTDKHNLKSWGFQKVTS